MTRVRDVCASLLLVFAQRHFATLRQPVATASRAAVHATGAGARDCTFPDTTSFVGPIRVADLADGLASDRRGPYLPGRDGVVVGGVTGSGVGVSAALTIYEGPSTPERHPRGFVVNLEHPVRGGGGRQRGIVTDTTGGGMGLMAQWAFVEGAARNLHDIRVGQTVKASMMSVTFFMNGRRYLLQMGPLPNGHCHNGGVTLVTGQGTTPATITRAASARWAIDVGAGGIARLFDVTDGTDHAEDLGRYHFRLHYDIGD